MPWTELHTSILTRAFEKCLGRPDSGSMAFVRCLTPDIVQTLSAEPLFAPQGWQTWRVADSQDEGARTITADRAVEMRESKIGAVLLLVDTGRAGAGMDGIYSAAREVEERSLFKEALALAEREITRRLSAAHRRYAELAVKRARGYGQRQSISLWTEFDYLCRIAAERKHPGEFLNILGLWPTEAPKQPETTDGLDVSRMFVERLLGRSVSGTSPTQRIDSLRLLNPSQQQLKDLEAFLRLSATKPLLSALAELVSKRHLWVNNLPIEGAAQTLSSIELLPWRTNTGRVAKWSGLIEEGEGGAPPVLILEPDADKTGNYSKLEIKWKARPDNLEQGAVEYRVAIVTDMEEELAAREVAHSGKREEKCRFSNDDFSTLSEDALISGKVIVSVIGNDLVEPQESEEFVIRFGQPPEREHGGVGKKVRTFSEGVIELDDRKSIPNLVSSPVAFSGDSKGFVLLRTQQPGKAFRIYRPALIHEVDKRWAERGGAIGRWTVRVRSSGARAAEVEFVPFPAKNSAAWDRAVTANRRMAERFAAAGGSVGQIYDETSTLFNTVVKEYLLAWSALLEDGDPELSLANTVEVQSLSGRTIGLVVLPSHPLRVAWLTAYDNLVLYTGFDQEQKAPEIRKELAILDGAMFPAFLPGLERGTSFVFADTLGFHAVGMVPDFDKEPKAAIAILARALGESEAADSAPTVGKHSAAILGNEVVKYLDCHNTSRLLHVHALRPGDGLTVARALGRVHEQYQHAAGEDLDDTAPMAAPGFVLELYPSEGQRAIAGRFIAEAREKRRTGAGVLAPEDQWMLESLGLPGGVSLPRLRWARKNEQEPQTAAHLAVAFDTFESRVVQQAPNGAPKARPLYAFGMLSFFDRRYSSDPAPEWSSTIPDSNEGEKHPSDRAHSDRLVRLQQVLHRLVIRNIAAEGLPALRTEVSPDKAQSLRQLHRLCDWVITLDRNAGIEYFDSPRDNRDIYDAYVIDCVPERQDLGCLQLITSTSNFEEVRALLDGALDQMGLSRSRRNAEFLMGHLKALSGRLAIRLTGDRAPTSELIALALSHANCCGPRHISDCWVPLDTGFFISADDVRDLLPPLVREDNSNETDSRPDLIYVSLLPRKGLSFRFIEVKYRRHLRTARSPETLSSIREQVESLRKRWDAWYCSADVCTPFRSVRRAKLARVLRFYADKAYRHHLSREQYEVMTAEIERMVEKGAEYAFSSVERCDRGWVFCPEFAGDSPMEASPDEWDTRVFLFGPDLLPDSDWQRSAPDLLPQAPGQSEDVAVSTESPEQSEKTEIRVEEASADERGFKVTNEASITEAPSVCFGLDTLSGADVRWPLTVRGNPHLLIAGLPGMGKTTCLLNLCQQMLTIRIRPIIFSYHQDIDEKLHRLVDSVRFVDFNGLGFNPLRVVDRRTRMAYLDVAGALRDIFTAIFPELGDIQGERIRRALKDSFIQNGWDNPSAVLEDLREPTFKRFLEILRQDPKPDRGLRTLLSRMDELDDYGFFDTRESDHSLWESDQPIVIRVHTTQNENLQKAFASLVFYGLYKDMFRRGLQDHITHAVVFDEAHRAAGLKLIPTMAKECRKYGISLVVASQEAKDFNISLFSAIANYLVLRLTEVDAKVLVRNVASSQQERVLVDKIKQMDRFRALYFCEGKVRPSLVALNP
jgi:DNA phosphorothioation-dependent restriction protein DptH